MSNDAAAQGLLIGAKAQCGRPADRRWQKRSLVWEGTAKQPSRDKTNNTADFLNRSSLRSEAQRLIRKMARIEIEKNDSDDLRRIPSCRPRLFAFPMFEEASSGSESSSFNTIQSTAKMQLYCNYSLVCACKQLH
ncbi:hypothetical protein PHSY_000948 [Pseudozyma hubeiensis SY62]|uniref:Uncharacterized protein n=1 Tax=Pseudozyma hubeiensis (strain SY62) TaxID=1305764 RepID=R9NXH4_PSEHS|nr:hypothetical protein PHSY_000948 [Pseudozyma hubeiensis SY62]GAC93383.1 hypothetical protein PHSY_000948 [Pseudozyma hubeiensis SY62]